MMLAAQCVALEGPPGIQVTELPPPEVGAGELRIAVDYAAVNFVDLLMTKGLYQVRPALPFVPGHDTAGVVVAVGEGVGGFATGDRVSVSVSYGAFAEEMIAPASRAVKLLPSVTMRDAAAYRMAYGTALYALRERADLQHGETLVVTGAAGSVGLAVLQIGRLLGAKVIGIVDSDNKADLVRAEGAMAIVEPDLTTLRDAIATHIPDGFAVAVDTLGGPGLLELVRGAGWGARILTLGFVAGIPDIPANRLLLKGASLVGVNYGAGQDRDAAANDDIHRQLMQWLADGEIAPRIAAEFPLSDASASLAALAQRGKAGKILIKVR